jgi:hypothetical protein
MIREEWNYLVICLAYFLRPEDGGSNIGELYNITWCNIKKTVHLNLSQRLPVFSPDLNRKHCATQGTVLAVLS